MASFSECIQLYICKAQIHSNFVSLMFLIARVGKDNFKAWKRFQKSCGL